MTASHIVEIRVHYPLTAGRMVLRSAPDWERDIEAASALEGHYDFRLPISEPYRHFKPVIVGHGTARWSAGANYLAIAGASKPREIYPYFAQDDRCSACDLRELPTKELGTRRYRVFYPPGYHENYFKRYPVIYMHDAQNLFFPDEAFGGHHWKIAETLEILDSMSLVEKVLVVGIYPEDREREYTLPGYEAYGKFVGEELKPAIDAEFRTLPGRETTAVMGSSLGGVVSLFMAWRWPEVFGMAGALSSTFGWRDDLGERVASEPKPPIRLYMDSGWPKDNYEVTRAMHARLLARGFADGTDLLYLAFPEAKHDESHWAMRCHIPLQFFFRRF